MRVARVGVVGMMMVVTALTVGCAAKKRAVVPARIVADEDRLDWAANEPDFVVIRKSCRTLDVYRYGQRIRGYPAGVGEGGKERKLYEGGDRRPAGLDGALG